MTSYRYNETRREAIRVAWEHARRDTPPPHPEEPRSGVSKGEGEARPEIGDQCAINLIARGIQELLAGFEAEWGRERRARAGAMKPLAADLAETALETIAADGHWIAGQDMADARHRLTRAIHTQLIDITEPAKERQS